MVFAVLSTFFSEIWCTDGAETEKRTVLVSRSTSESVARICSYLNEIVPQANVSILSGAPQPSLIFRSVGLKTCADSKSKVTDQQASPSLQSVLPKRPSEYTSRSWGKFSIGSHNFSLEWIMKKNTSMLAGGCLL